MTQARVRERVAEAFGVDALARVSTAYLAPDRAAFDESGLTVADVVAAAEARASQGCEGCLLEALQMIDWVPESHPEQVDALAARGWLLARTGDAELLRLGIDYLDGALSVQSDHRGALVYRAFALLATGDAGAARADLDTFDALVDQPEHLLRLIEAQQLREALSR